MLTSTSSRELPDLLRQRIRDILQEEPFFAQMDHMQIARTLVQTAFSCCDCNGGIDDTCHASKQLHRLVDEAGSELHAEYSPEKLQEYLRKTK